MKNEKIEISKVVVKMGGKEVNLTIDQAKELSKILNDMFNSDSGKKEHHYHHYQTWPYYYSGSYPNTCWSQTIVGSTNNSLSGCTTTFNPSNITYTSSNEPQALMLSLQS